MLWRHNFEFIDSFSRMPDSAYIQSYTSCAARRYSADATSAAANRRVQDRGKPVVSVCPLPETKGDGLQVAHIADWLERVDPETHRRRIKGLRLVTAYGIAALLGHLPEFSRGLSNSAWLSFLAAGFALWASVSEARTTRAASSRDLVVLCAAAAVGAVSMILLSPVLSGSGRPGAELTLVSGAFLVGYLRRSGVLGIGVGSQIYIGQLLAYGAHWSTPTCGASSLPR
jgi:hypothetical protein